MLSCAVILELWLEWLHDEISMAMDGLDREHVYELFERAVKDYICEYAGPGVLLVLGLLPCAVL